MPSTPFMKFYVGDYLGDTAHLSCLEHGAYMLLIMAYWQNKGPLKNDPKLLRRYTRTSPKEYQKWSENVLRMFQLKDNTLIHKRIDFELRARDIKSCSNRLSANKRWNKDDANAMRTQCVDDAIAMPLPESIFHIPDNKKKYKKENIKNSAVAVVGKRDLLRDALDESFKSKIKTYASPAKENANLVKLSSAIRRKSEAAGLEPSAGAKRMVETFWRLHETGKQFWSDFTPSKMLGAFEGIWSESVKDFEATDLSWLEEAAK